MDEVYSIEIEVSKGQYNTLKDIRDILNRTIPEDKRLTLPKTVLLLVELGLQKMDEEVTETRRRLKDGL